MQDADTLLNRMVLTAGRMETLLERLQRQVADSQSAIEATREAQEARFRQTLTRLFEQQQAQIAAALQPRIAWAWKVLIALAASIALLLAGGTMLLKHTQQRLQVAESRAAAAEVNAEVQEALRHVRITSCGGRPCALLDRDQPTWKAKQGEYVLLDGRPAP
jgi:hypothetical protein